MILDFVKCRIEAFNREQGGGVAVSKDDMGYTLTSEDTGIPIAKLRRKGKARRVSGAVLEPRDPAMADGQPVRRIGFLTR